MRGTQGPLLCANRGPRSLPTPGPHAFSGASYQHPMKLFKSDVVERSDAGAKTIGNPEPGLSSCGHTFGPSHSC